MSKMPQSTDHQNQQADRDEQEAKSHHPASPGPDKEHDSVRSAKYARRQGRKRAAPSGKVVYQAIMTEGVEELERSASALFWSGLAAGLSMGASVIALALLNHHLPERAWRPLVAELGYSVGFLIVILGRQQLFTENTLTPILPLLADRSWRRVRQVGKLWGVVLVANLLGSAILALALTKTPLFSAEVREEFVKLGEHAFSHGFGTTLVRGIGAGWLIALVVWLLPLAEGSRVWVIIILTYLVGLSEFTHVIVGSTEAYILAAAGRAGWWAVLGGYTLPTLIGNILGGVTLVAALNYGQVAAEDGDEAEQSPSPRG